MRRSKDGRDILRELRYYARGVVLPVERIRSEIIKATAQAEIKDPILDFGAGSLFWTDWFLETFPARVCSIDPLFAKSAPPGRGGRVRTYAGLDACLKENRRYSFIWACDVLHHIRDYSQILKSLSAASDLIIIKDIAAESAWGNLQNRIHDLVFSRELVSSVSYKKLSEELRCLGFGEIEVVQLPRLGYSHFLLAAKRAGKGKNAGRQAVLTKQQQR